MSSLPNVAIVGASGMLGSVILEKVLAAGFPVTILTRRGSSSASKLPSHENQTIKEVDYSSEKSLTEAFKGTQVVVSTITTTAAGDQDKLINAAVAAGTVTRFIPSDFGSDIYHPKNVDLPVFQGKIATSKKLEELSKEHPHFTHTSIYNNIFFDWALEVGFLVDLKNHTATLWDGGDRRFSTTTLGTVADAVVAVVKDLDGTANKIIKIQDAVLSQNQLIEIAKKIDGKDWTTTPGSTEEQVAEAYAELKKPEPNGMKAMMGFLTAAIFGEDRDIYATQVENECLGLRQMDQAEIENVVKQALQKVQG